MVKMHQTKISLDLEKRKKSIALLQQGVVDSINLAIMCKQAHWNVKGETFIAIHELFDRVHEKVQDYSDMMAERLMSLGGTTQATLPSIKKQSRLAPYPEDIFSTKAHIDALSSVIAHFGGFVREAIDQSAASGDLGTSDLFTAFSRDLDHFLWFLEAHLQ